MKELNGSEFCEIFKNNYFIEHPRVTASVSVDKLHPSLSKISSGKWTGLAHSIKKTRKICYEKFVITQKQQSLTFNIYILLKQKFWSPF